MVGDDCSEPPDDEDEARDEDRAESHVTTYAERLDWALLDSFDVDESSIVVADLDQPTHPLRFDSSTRAYEFSVLYSY